MMKLATITIALAAGWLAVPGMPNAQITPSTTAPASARPAQSIMFTGLEVPDIAKAQAFYVDAIGMRVALHLTPPGAAVAEVALNFSGDPASGETMLILLHRTTATADQNHSPGAKLVLRVADARAVVERVRKAGYTVGREVRQTARAGSLLGHVIDPNGVLVELVQF